MTSLLLRMGGLLLVALHVGSVSAALQRTRPAPPFRVLHVSPALNALDVSRTTKISVRFSLPVDEASLTDRNFQVMGRWSAICPGTTTLRRNGTVLDFQPSGPFSAGETVYVALTGVRSVFGQTLSSGFAWSFWAKADAGSSNFTIVDTLIAGTTPYGAYGGDVNEDGHLDLCVPNEDSSDVSVYLGNGTGTFGAPTSYGVGFHCSPSEGVDLNLDGKLDFVVANILDHDISVLLGNGDGTFQPQQRYAVGTQPRGMCVVDADGDGDLDAVTSNRSSSDLSLLLNQGDGTFGPERRFDAGVGSETGVAAVDMNRDGIADLVVIGNAGSVSVLFGDGIGGFTLHSARPVGSGPWMVATGDVDGDGWVDVAVALSSGGSAAVLTNDRAGGLNAPTAYPTGSFPIAIDLGDLDGDGLLDLTTSNYGGGDYTLYYNQGGGVFGGSATLPALVAGSCTVLHDFDADGDLDITAIDELADRVFCFRQDG